jgi:hypothetical protein
MDRDRPQQAHPAHNVAAASNNTGGLLNTILVVLLIVTSILATAYLGLRILGTSNTSTAIKSKQYQALFLTNGQVYFGKLKSVDASYVKLTDIYYLQVQQQVQPKDDKANNGQQPQVSLAKLGGELHGPEDSMYVSREQVLFWENLTEQGKVATAIKDYKASGKK